MTHFIRVHGTSPYRVIYDPTALIDPRLIVSGAEWIEGHIDEVVEGLRAESRNGSLILLDLSTFESVMLYLDETIPEELGPFLDSSTTVSCSLIARTSLIECSSIMTLGGKENELFRIQLETAGPGIYRCEVTKMFKRKIDEQIDGILVSRFGLKHRLPTLMAKFGCLVFLLVSVDLIVSLSIGRNVTFDLGIIVALVLNAAFWVMVDRSRLWSEYRESKRELERRFPDNIIQISWAGALEALPIVP